MTTKQQQQPQTVTQTQEHANRALLDKVLDNPVTYRPFMADKDVTLTPRLVIRYLVKPTKQGHTCTVEQAVRFIRLCDARGLNPWEGDAFLVGYDTKDGPEFNLITAHQALLKRAETHPEYDGMESGVTFQTQDNELQDVAGTMLPDGVKVVAGWARVHFKGRSVAMYKRLRLTTYDKGISRWNADREGMICKCAEAAALRGAFPTKCGGMYLREEMDSSEVGHEVSAAARQDTRVVDALNAAESEAKAAEAATAANGKNGTNQHAAQPPAEPQAEDVAELAAEFARKLANSKNLVAIGQAVAWLESQCSDPETIEWARDRADAQRDELAQPAQ